MEVSTAGPVPRLALSYPTKTMQFCDALRKSETLLWLMRRGAERVSAALAELSEVVAAHPPNVCTRAPDGSRPWACLEGLCVEDATTQLMALVEGGLAWYSAAPNVEVDGMGRQRALRASSLSVQLVTTVTGEQHVLPIEISPAQVSCLYPSVRGLRMRPCGSGLAREMYAEDSDSDSDV